MTIRQLDPKEYSRLEDHPILKGVGVPSPDASRIFIAEEEGEIVAFWMMVAVAHLEPIWISDRYRSTTLAGRLWKCMRGALSALAIRKAYAFADREEIRDYLDRLGFESIPYTVHTYKEQ